MGKTVAIANQKGGVGKTTTAVNLCASLSYRGRRVLLVDCDPQGNATTAFGLKKAEANSIYDVMLGDKTAREAVTETRYGSIIGSGPDLAGANVELVDIPGREFVLMHKLKSLQDVFDFIIIDCPPSLELLTLNALVAAEEVIIPLQPHFLALHGLSKLLETIELVAKRLNGRLRVSGVVLCLYDGHTTLANDVRDDVKAFFGANEGRPAAWRNVVVFDTNIRRNIRLAEAPSYGQSIFDYDPKSNGAEDYRALAREVLAME
jgi:chromosome partitioning protein